MSIIHVPTTNPLYATNNIFVGAAAAPHATPSRSDNNDTVTKNSNNNVTNTSFEQTALPPAICKDVKSVTITNNCVSIHDSSTDSSLKVCDSQKNNYNASRN